MTWPEMFASYGALALILVSGLAWAFIFNYQMKHPFEKKEEEEKPNPFLKLLEKEQRTLKKRGSLENGRDRENLH